MDTLSQHDVAKALARVARRKLVRGESIELPDFGTLDVRHERSVVEERSTGETVLQPPKDRVVFTPAE